MFAVIHTGGKQYKVAKGETLEVEKIEAEDGTNVEFDQVLLVNDGKETKVGTPTVSGAVVKAKIVEQTKADKIRVFKMKAKKRYQKTQGHRQKLTMLEIVDIKG